MKHTAAILLALMLFTGCEQTVDTDWPDHEEKLVVTGFLQFRTDSVFVYARVNRTLPLSEPFNDSKAIINDALVQVRDAAITHDIPRDSRFYPLQYDFNYRGVFVRDASKDYSFTVRQGGKTANAALIIDESSAEFDQLEISETGSSGYVHARWTLRTPDRRSTVTCYFEHWDSRHQTWMETQYFDLNDYSQRDGDVLRGESYVWTGTNETHPRLRYVLVVRDGVYTDYSNTRWSWDSGGGIFEPESKNPPFNVTGDGIGFVWYEFRGDPVEVVY
ncbi:DUF4249 domain-containing protein [bacterium]|nr:DUF4249 domain-containing protein [bacterium]